MAGRGPIPKGRSARARDQVRRHGAMTVLPAEGPQEPRKLPPRGDGERWLPQTRRWWHIWATSPQAAAFIETDWAELELLARLVDAYYDGNLSMAPEMRLRAAKLGATAEDRARLHMVVEDPPAAPPEASGGRWRDLQVDDWKDDRRRRLAPPSDPRERLRAVDRSENGWSPDLRGGRDG